MKLIQQIFRDYASACLRMYGPRMPVDRRKVLEAIIRCRTQEAGIHLAHSSCGNRHCPVCQNEKAAGWVFRQQLRGLPCTYFMATFTLPRSLHELARHYPEGVYQALFAASSHALKKLEADKRFVGCSTAGFFGILHTWERQMQFHPHIHYVIAGGGLSKDRCRWIPSGDHFLVHVRALSSLFRGRFKAELVKRGLLEYVPGEVWRKDWVVHCKAVGNGQRALRYLGAYVFRVAMSDARILSYDGKSVTFKYRKVGSRRERRCTLPAIVFIRRFLLHVLPRGFVKIRHYGFLHARCSVTIERIREFIARVHEELPPFVKPDPPKPFKPLLCKRCRCVMRWKRFIAPRRWSPVYGP